MPAHHRNDASPSSHSPVRTRRSRFLLYVALFCVFVIVYASLQPFSGWSPAHFNLFVFFTTFSKYLTRADLAFNVVAYAPLGFALFAALPLTWRAHTRALAMFALVGALSIALEALQAFLPTRVSSIYDTLANAAGACIGAAVAAWVFSRSDFVARIHELRERYFVRGATGDLNILLLAVWLIAQVNPGIPLFGATFHPGFVTAFDPVVVAIELAQTTAALIGIALFTDLTLQKRAHGGIALVIMIATAVALKTIAASVLLTPIAWEAWLRPGHALGIALGAVALLILFWLPRLAKSILAGIALLSSVLIPLLLPDLATLRAPVSLFEWNYGQLLNLNGLTRTIVTVWPFVATTVLLLRFGGDATPKQMRAD